MEEESKIQHIPPQNIVFLSASEIKPPTHPPPILGLTSSKYENNDSGDESESGDDDGEDDKKKQKRRSKNDVQGRDHRCNYCDKTYLSYPALYTHMKNKHAKGPDG